MLNRPFWLARLADAWRERSVIWLMGVRRAGKTVLAQSVPKGEYLDCERPSVRRQLEDPESFLAQRRGGTVVLDEIHRLPDAAQLLKLAADHFPTTKVLATGSSTLGASARFRDTLAGRKREVWLTPMVQADLQAFSRVDIQRRLLRGGLPPFFLADTLPERDFQEWTDSYWAKDVLELFRLERRHAFQRLLELLMAQSGGIFEATPLARACEVSRPTISTYLAVLEATFVMHVVRPFAHSGAAEIIAAPRVYGFDTGFVCHHRGWHQLRREDCGPLWEHLVLNQLHAHCGREPVHYWRTKHGNEIDFVLARRGRPPVAIECKWAADSFAPAGLKAFRNRYPAGDNIVVAEDVDRAFTKHFGGLAVRFIGIDAIAQEVAN